MTSQLLPNRPYKPPSPRPFRQPNNSLFLFYTASLFKRQNTYKHNTNMSSSAGLSNVGKGALYEAGDQRNEPRSVINERERYEEGQTHSHKNIDSSMYCLHNGVVGLVFGVWCWIGGLTRCTTEDDRSLANKLASQARSDEPGEQDRGYDPEAELSKRNPEAPVCTPYFPHAACSGLKSDVLTILGRAARKRTLQRSQGRPRPPGR